MGLEISIEKIGQIAKDRLDENKAFREYLEGLDSDKIDQIVERLNNEITPQIDCVKCGNCCLNLRPVVNEDVLKLFVTEENMEKYKYSWGFACKNIDNKKCTIYLDRPQECRLYPYMDTDKFVSRIHGVLQNYEICPIVFNVFEGLKKELAWSFK